MIREKMMVEAWEHGFWFAWLRVRRINPLSVRRGLAFKCSELIGYDRFLLMADRHRKGGKGSM